ncbi:hypothetical protein AMS61_24860 [Bacillus sp. FJAT-21351]|nr:hypothetical protein AMS61_24860 [Bacillus sp. FJAT-21351]
MIKYTDKKIIKKVEFKNLWLFLYKAFYLDYHKKLVSVSSRFRVNHKKKTTRMGSSGFPV